MSDWIEDWEKVSDWARARIVEEVRSFLERPCERPEPRAPDRREAMAARREGLARASRGRALSTHAGLELPARGYPDADRRARSRRRQPALPRHMGGSRRGGAARPGVEPRAQLRQGPRRRPPGAHRIRPQRRPHPIDRPAHPRRASATGSTAGPSSLPPRWSRYLGRTNEAIRDLLLL
jgi:hypothetical protein